MALARTGIEEVFGEDSVAYCKTEVGTGLDFTSWHLDPDLQVLGIARYNLLKTLYWCCVAREQAYSTVRELLR